MAISTPSSSPGESLVKHYTLAMGHREFNLRLGGELPPCCLALVGSLKVLCGLLVENHMVFSELDPASCNTDPLGNSCPLLQQWHGCYEIKKKKNYLDSFED